MPFPRLEFNRRCLAARLDPGVADACHALPSLPACPLAFHSHVPVRCRADIVRGARGRTDRILQRCCLAARLDPGLADACHALPSLPAGTLAFHSHPPVRYRADIVRGARGRADRILPSAVASPHASTPASPMPATPCPACRHAP